MIFPWSRAARRRELLARPFPAAWGPILARANYGRGLTPEKRARARDIVRVLVAEKDWEGAGGLAMTDGIRVTVAAQAARLVLGFDGDYFANVETVLVYPQGFLVTVRSRAANGATVERTVPYAGEAALRGPVVLSWADVLASGGGRNVVLHEFAHTLDMRDGAADGVPYLRDAAQAGAWARVMAAEYRHLVEQSEAQEPTLLDPYGATNAAEFFAVATECFFGLSREMRAAHPDLYAVLSDFYRQDPARGD